ncbi:hypothetical protein ACWA5Z_12095 [Testudinibacter sp. P80/BLE/0925]
MELTIGLGIFALLGLIFAIGMNYLAKHPYPKGYKPEQNKK